MTDAISNSSRSTVPLSTRSDDSRSVGRSKATSPISAADNKASNESIRESLEVVVRARDGANAKVTKDTKFNEGDLYAALTHHRLKQTNPEAAAKFAAELPQAIQRNRSDSGEALTFRAAESVLRKLEDEGTISKDEFRTVRNYAFSRAQLDEDRNQIGKGAQNAGGATTSFDELIRFLLLNPDATPEEIQAFQNGQKTGSASGANSEIATTGAAGTAQASGGPASPKGPSVAVDAPRGFLWKPTSDSNGKLAILLPPGMSKDAQSVKILSPDGKTELANGKFTGIGNGDRAHFRFDQPGSAFPEGAIVQITDKSGKVTEVVIKDPAIRNEGNK